MMKKALISLIGLFAVSLMAGAQVSHHEVKVGNFSRLVLLDNINVNYCCNPDSAGYAVFTCNQETADHLYHHCPDLAGPPNKKLDKSKGSMGEPSIL